MAVTVASFLINYPEFASAPATLIDAKLAEARQLTPSFVWNAGGDPARDLTDQAVGLYCASFLYDSPYARKMATAPTGAKTHATPVSNPYAVRLRELKAIVGSGYRVL